ncbi:MAG TPA: DUF3592 domain-containing protein [Xanthobacteraceae bacterium]|nr:DUF3592 domain-containing protein [Xanthobacteraceae bacterium]
MRLAALVVALIATGLLWRSASTLDWSPKVAEWMGFVGAMGICMFPFAAYMLVDGWVARRRASDAVSWPHARGTIASSRVRLTSFKFALYMADVTYRYAVKGTDFTGNAIQATRIASSKSTAREIAARYPVGAEVDVRYDPRSPGSSMLELGDGAARGRMIMAAIFFAVPIILATLGVWYNHHS